jgi:hypothetical protein
VASKLAHGAARHYLFQPAGTYSFRLLSILYACFPEIALGTNCIIATESIDAGFCYPEFHLFDHRITQFGIGEIEFAGIGPVELRNRLSRAVRT